MSGTRADSRGSRADRAVWRATLRGTLGRLLRSVAIAAPRRRGELQGFPCPLRYDCDRMGALLPVARDAPGPGRSRNWPVRLGFLPSAGAGQPVGEERRILVPHRPPPARCSLSFE